MLFCETPAFGAMEKHWQNNYVYIIAFTFRVTYDDKNIGLLNAPKAFTAFLILALTSLSSVQLVLIILLKYVK